MWRALDLVSQTVSSSGALFIALYDDAGVFSRLWLPIKKYFNKIPPFLRLPYLLMLLPIIEGPPVIRNIMNFRSPFAHWRDYFRKRGMSRWHDIEDWVGGYPYEFTKCDKVFEFYRSRGFRLDRLTCAGLGGNNQFVFTRGPRKRKPVTGQLARAISLHLRGSYAVEEIMSGYNHQTRISVWRPSVKMNATLWEVLRSTTISCLQTQPVTNQD